MILISRPTPVCAIKIGMRKNLLRSSTFGLDHEALNSSARIGSVNINNAILAGAVPESQDRSRWPLVSPWIKMWFAVSWPAVIGPRPVKTDHPGSASWVT